MNFKKIGAKVLTIILPVTIAMQGILTIVSAVSSDELIEKEMAEKMEAELDYNQAEITGYLDEVKAMATNIACTVGDTYKTLDMSTYEEMLSDIIVTNDIVLGSGLWFEPYAYDASEEYMGPYIYKDGDSLAVTYDYSNADYDYFNQEYYINAMSSDEAQITDPYYDATSNTIMSTCSIPIKDNGTVIGCVTVDIELTAINDLIDSVKVGKAGSGMLTTADGTYLAGVSKDKVENALNIASDSNASVAAAGKEIVGKDSGMTVIKENGEEYNLYYASIDGLGWKLIIKIPSIELKQPVYLLINKLVMVCIAAVAIITIIMIMQIGGITKSIGRVQRFASELADGDFTVNTLHVKGRDEIAGMSESLNNMYNNNKHIIQDISTQSEEIQRSNVELNDCANKLKEEFTSISTYMSTVNEAMMNSSAATEELTASAEQVEESVEILANETSKSLTMVHEIKGRADGVGEASKNSYEIASSMQQQYEKELADSIEKAKVVENIGEMASIISDIADQITLLSLNASIEAARAGEQGRGFAVVATEIGKLAGDTAQAVGQIQSTITEVQNSFEELAGNATTLLNFVSDTVTPDYKKFVEVAEQYGQDADSFSKLSETVSSMSESINQIMTEITNAIQNIAESTQNTADVSSNIMTSIDGVTGVVNQVTDMSVEQQNITNNLNSIVRMFKL